jgi:hypothetical protein
MDELSVSRGQKSEKSFTKIMTVVVINLEDTECEYMQQESGLLLVSILLP